MNITCTYCDGIIQLDGPPLIKSARICAKCTASRVAEQVIDELMFAKQSKTDSTENRT